MSRSRHFRRILAAGVVASLSITLGAGVAFATDSPAPIDQSNDVGVNASAGTCEPNGVSTDTPGLRCVNDLADANTGKNLQGNAGQANVTGQGDLAIATGQTHHEESMDAFAAGFIFAVAIGGDAGAWAGNHASSDNNATVNNTLTGDPEVCAAMYPDGEIPEGNSCAGTGNARAVNIASLDGSQNNWNSGDVLTIGLGNGLSAINQSNNAVIYADNNLAKANSGKNIQGSGGQLNLTGQVALAGAAGSPALALSLGFGIAAGGDAFAIASNSSGHSCCPDPGSKDNFSNFQTVNNNATTGNAVAGNSVQVGTPGAKVDDPATDVDETKDVPFKQTNTNSGNAYTAVAFGSFAGSFIGQSNNLYVGPSNNAAIANSGLNLQGSGSQLNGTLQVAGAGALGNWAGAVGLLGVGLAFGGDAVALAFNHSDSGNSQTVNNTLVTGDALASNFTGVIAEQKNDNSGNAGALQILNLGIARVGDVVTSVISGGFGVAGIIQTNTAELGSFDNFALANSGANAQIGGFQGNGTVQGAGALAIGGWAGALGAFALAKAGDATAIAGNGAKSNNESTVHNNLTTGAATAQNYASLDVKQTNSNTGWAAGVAAIDVFGVGIGFIYQSNSAGVGNEGNTAIANTGANVQGTLGQGNLTLQGSAALAGGGTAISLGLVAGAVGGDGTALAGNKSWSSNSQKVDNKATTGDADASNITKLDLEQSNFNGGDGHHDGDVAGVALAGVGIGAGVIIQTNAAEADGGYNTAVANTGANAQFTGPQVNITGQLALAGAGGGGALGIGLLGAGAFGGDALAGAANFANSTNWQQVCNDLVTGVASAVNAVIVSAKQTNENHGDARGLVIADVPLLYAGAISQSNALIVQSGDNTAIANSGANVQVAGPQANVTLQASADAAQAGGSAAAGGIGAISVDGDANAGAVNVAGSVNTVDVSNNLQTGNATAVNQTSVDVTQDNQNHGDADAVGL